LSDEGEPQPEAEADPETETEPEPESDEPEDLGEEIVEAVMEVTAPARSLIAGVVALAAGYELAADAFNQALGEPVIPSAITAIRRFRARDVAAKAVPEPARIAMMMAAGFAIGVVGRRLVSRR
jgi:hypothetical protein